MDHSFNSVASSPIKKKDKLGGPELTSYDWSVLGAMVFLYYRNVIKYLSFYGKAKKQNHSQS